MSYGLIIGSIFLFLLLSTLVKELTKKIRFNRWSNDKLQEKYSEASAETKNYEWENAHSLDSYWNDRNSDMKVMEKVASERGIVLTC